MGVDEISKALGTMSAQLTALNDRVTCHLHADENWHKRAEEKFEELTKMVLEARNKIERAHGAQQMLVWIIGVGIPLLSLIVSFRLS